jgi:hypothetical protein
VAWELIIKGKCGAGSGKFRQFPPLVRDERCMAGPLTHAHTGLCWCVCFGPISVVLFLGAGVGCVSTFGCIRVSRRGSLCVQSDGDLIARQLHVDDLIMGYSDRMCYGGLINCVGQRLNINLFIGCIRVGFEDTTAKWKWPGSRDDCASCRILEGKELTSRRYTRWQLYCCELTQHTNTPASPSVH